MIHFSSLLLSLRHTSLLSLLLIRKITICSDRVTRDTSDTSASERCRRDPSRRGNGRGKIGASAFSPPLAPHLRFFETPACPH